MRKFLAAILLFFFPVAWVSWLLNFLGHRIDPGARVGFSWVFCEKIYLKRRAKIGAFNVIYVKRILLHEEAVIGRANLLAGPYSVLLKSNAAIGNRNRVLRGGAQVVGGPAKLVIGVHAKITSDHRVDCTRSFKLGDYSIIAGAATQIWTHGYIHDVQGLGRYRIDGAVIIENNVYIGSACLISMGVRISSGIIVGGGACISKSINSPGLYVSAGLRHLPRPMAPDGRSDLDHVDDPSLCERVYLKRGP